MITRNYLYYPFCQIAAWFNAESLCHGKRLRDSKGKMKLLFAQIPARELKGSGYRVKAVLMNAKYFGVPQSRKRMIFIGVRENMNIDPQVHPSAKYQAISLQDACHGIETIGIPVTDQLGEIGKQARAGEKFSQTRARLGMNHSNFSTYKVVWDKPLPTITKTMAPNCPGLVHPDVNNMLSIAALKRCGSFPDDFILTGSDIDQWARIGNSVPPLLMKAIAEAIRQNVLEYSTKQ